MPATRVRIVERIHARLRTAIMSGRYEPGAALSQVELARSFGVSRTPLREAIRRLEAEGLIEARQNRRARVTTIDAESLDVKFTERILVEAMGVQVTVPGLTEVDLNAVLACTAALRVGFERGDAPACDRARRSLHVRYAARAGARLRAAIAAAFDACEPYRRRFIPLATPILAEYTAIAAACVARDAAEASRRIARLEAGLARAVLARVDPDYDAVAIRTALAMLEAGRVR